MRGRTDAQDFPHARDKSRVLVTFPDYPIDDPAYGGRLRGAGATVRLAPKTGTRSESEILDLAAGCNAIIASTDPFSARVLAGLPDLEIIARVGVGVDSIDLRAAESHNVAVTAATGTNEAAVADHTLALMLAALHRIVAQDAAVRKGVWERTGPVTGFDLTHKTVGLVGLGTIAEEVATRLEGFDVDIIAHDPLIEYHPTVQLVTMTDLLKQADVISLHVPLKPATRHLIGPEELASMKPGVVLVNTSRGGVVDEASLIGSLRSGHVRCAALDVFECEPPFDSDLLYLEDRTILTPHVAGLTRESIAAMQRHATDAVLDWMAGRTPHGLVSGRRSRTNTRVGA